MVDNELNRHQIDEEVLESVDGGRAPGLKLPRKTEAVPGSVEIEKPQNSYESPRRPRGVRQDGTWQRP